MKFTAKIQEKPKKVKGKSTVYDYRQRFILVPQKAPFEKGQVVKVEINESKT